MCTTFILGFIFADGSINTSLHHNQINIQINPKDIEVLEFIKSKIQPSSNILQYEKFCKNTNKNYAVARISFSSKKIVKDLINLGCVPGKTYKEIRVPNIPIEFYRDFIRGVFDGDGSIYISKKSSTKVGCFICCSSVSFLKDIKNIIGFGNINENESPARLSFYKKNNIQLFFDYMYNGNFCLIRKFKKFKEAFDNYEL